MAVGKHLPMVIFIYKLQVMRLQRAALEISELNLEEGEEFERSFNMFQGYVLCAIKDKVVYTQNHYF